MKVVILAGGMGTRISEESRLKPKPMIEVGNRPILWHIMKWYASFRFHEFIVCCGYKGHLIKRYFINYQNHQKDIFVDLGRQSNDIKSERCEEPWRVTLVNTGLRTLTAGRLLKVKEYIGNERFMLTYGDGVSDVNIEQLVESHKQSGKIVTITVTQPAGRFGAIQMDESRSVCGFKEKARKDQSFVNAGFMVMEPGIFEYLGDGSEMLEGSPFELLAENNQMNAYQHEGFWAPMDTMHDKAYLEGLWQKDRAPWKVGG